MNYQATIPPQVVEKKRRSVWIAQVFLFLTFMILGSMKLAMSIPTLTEIMQWPGSLPEWLVRAIGAAELAGALGVLLPDITGIMTWLTSYAAFGLMVVMICALGYHIMLFQGIMLLPSLSLGLIATYVGVKRMGAVNT